MRLALVFFLLCTPAFAQQIGQPAYSDLNGDGLDEKFVLMDNGNGSADLHIINMGETIVTAPAFAWLGGIGQQPEINLADNGSVLVTSMNEAIGRNRWHQTMTIAFRNDAYTIAGYTYDGYDTLDLDAASNCDFNLLNGRGFVTYGQDGTPFAYASPWRSMPVSDWNDGILVPDVCYAPTQ